ncbi:MAG: 50S ribosomal protein L24 [Spirochaetes bacterium RBG_16_49_21]|nr:MAG: 50S ribosomal protein L24 [Spirochaetes bacterium RBG_16_49_21]
MNLNKEQSRIKANDNVVVTAGSDRGRRGKVLKIGAKRGRIIVEGINKRNKYIKPGPESPKGGTANIEFPIDMSNVMIFCDKCKKGVRIGIAYKDDKKTRVCKKCGKNLD